MSKKALFTLFLVIFIDLAGFGIIIPILPYYAQNYGAKGFEIGLLMSIYSFMQFLIAPLWGKLSDRVGRRPVLLVSILGTCLSLIVLGLAQSLTWLFIARFLAGICGANISTAYAYVSDVTTEKNRAKGMGIIGAAFGLGFMFGPAIGGLLSQYSYQAPMFFGAALAAVNFIFAWFSLKEPKISEEIRATHRHQPRSFKVFQKVLGQSSQTLLAIGLFFLVVIAVTQMEVLFAIFMKAEYGFNAKKAGMALAGLGLIMVLIQGGAIGRLTKKFGEKKLIFFGTAIGCIGLSIFAATNSVWVAMISLCFMTIGHSFLHPCLSSLASLSAPKQFRGTTMGVFHSAGSLARVVGPPTAGALYDHINHGAPFYSGALILAVGFFILFIYERKRVES